MPMAVIGLVIEAMRKSGVLGHRLPGFDVAQADRLAAEDLIVAADHRDRAGNLPLRRRTAASARGSPPASHCQTLLPKPRTRIRAGAVSKRLRIDKSS